MDPLDSFFFRSSVPFEDKGETIAVESSFPPLPSVYCGAFRNLYKIESNQKGRIEVGYNGIVLDQECLFPMPLDLSYSTEEEGKISLQKMDIDKRPISNYPLPFCCYQKKGKGKDKIARRVFMTGQQMAKYLNEGKAQLKGIDLNQGYLTYMPKIGISIDPQSKQAEDERFYQITEVRPAMNANIKLAAEIKIKTCDQETIQSYEKCFKNTEELHTMKLGGEGKIAKVRSVDKLALPLSQKADTNCFKLYLGTPAIFAKGWLPGWVDEDNDYIGTYAFRERKVKVKLLCAQVGRTVPCGGFGYDKESNKKQPRELHFAVPAGSVYYFQLLEGKYEDAVWLFHGKCISDYHENKGFIDTQSPEYRFNKYRYCDKGFGYALVGRSEEMEEKIK